MNQEGHRTHLVSSEIGNLWSTYMNDSLSICVFRYALETLEDENTKHLFQQALTYSHQHLKQIQQFLDQEHYLIPKGFGEEDVNVQAPRLYSDEFLLFYLNQMATHGLTAYALAIASSVLPDVRKFFIQGNQEAIQLYEQSLDCLLSKGIYERPPQIPTSQDVGEVESIRYVTGGWFGKHRPLNAVEISSIFFNLKKSILAKGLAISFSQTATHKDVRNFMAKVVETAQKHIEQFNHVFHDDYLGTPSLWDAHITESKVPPFSDKLMMNLGSFLISAAMGYYGTGRSTAMRVDITTLYGTVILRDEKLAAQGMNLMIQHGWMEEIPHASDRKALVKK